MFQSGKEVVPPKFIQSQSDLQKWVLNVYRYLNWESANAEANESVEEDDDFKHLEKLMLNNKR